MSRVEKHNSTYTIAYGHDHILGFFIQIFDNTLEDEEERDEPIVDMDEYNTPNLNVDKIVAIAEEYGFDISYELSERTIS